MERQNALRSKRLIKYSLYHECSADPVQEYDRPFLDIYTVPSPIMPLESSNYISLEFWEGANPV